MTANKSNAVEENEVVFQGFTRGQLEAAFTKVQSARGWKFPIHATIEQTERDVTDAAISFFAGGGAKFSNSRDGKLNVIAPGYYVKIGA